MIDKEKTATAELAFELGKITRHAMGFGTDEASEIALSELALRLMEAGQDKVVDDMLLVFVAGFQAEPQPDRRAA